MSIKPKIKTWLTYDSSKPSKREELNNISLTVPDQSQSIRELLDRHQRGLIVQDNGMQAFYDETQSYKDPKFMDLVDIDIMRRQLTEEIKQHEKVLADYAKEEDRRTLERRAKERDEFAKSIRDSIKNEGREQGDS